MCPWVGTHAPSFGRQLLGLPSRVEYLSPQGMLLPRVYGTTASPLWLGLRGPAAWQATPSWTVYRVACHRLLPWLQVTFAMVHDAAWLVSDQRPSGTAPAACPVGRLGRPSAPDPWGVVSCCPSSVALGAHVCAVSWATWRLFTGVPAWCCVSHVRCPVPLGSYSPVCLLGALHCVCSVLGLLAPVHRCACFMHCVARAVSWATWLLLTGVFARCVVLCVRCPSPLGSCSPVCPLGVLCCVACAVSWATWLPFTGVPSRCVASLVRRPGTPGSCLPVCLLRALFCVCGVLGHLTPVNRCARSVCCIVCAASWAAWLLFTGALARGVVLRVRCPWPLGSCSPGCSLGMSCRVCGVLGLLAPVQRCARSACCVVCAVSWATWLLFTGVLARRVVLRVRCPGLRASFSAVRSPAALCCVYGVLGHLASVHQGARSVCRVACRVSWASCLLFADVLARCVLLRVRCPGPLGSCSRVCPSGVLCCVCSVLCHLAPVHRCASSARCVAYAVSWATWLLFTGEQAWCVVLRVRCHGLLGFCSLVGTLHALCCVCGVLGPLAPVLWCGPLACCVACAVSLATWLLFAAVLARCAVLCIVCAVSWASCLLFTGVRAGCAALRVWGVAAGRAPVHPDGCYS